MRQTREYESLLPQRTVTERMELCVAWKISVMYDATRAIFATVFLFLHIARMCVMSLFTMVLHFDFIYTSQGAFFANAMQTTSKVCI